MTTVTIIGEFMEQETHGGLVINHASRAIHSHYSPILVNHLVEEEQRVRLDNLVHRTLPVPALTATVTHQTLANGESATTGDKSRILHDSAVHPEECATEISSNSKQTSSTTRGHRSRTRQTKYSLTDFIYSHCSSHAVTTGTCHSCQYVSGTRKTASDISEIGRPAETGSCSPRGTLLNWLKMVKPEAPAVLTEESWPPLLSSKTIKDGVSAAPTKDTCKAFANNRNSDTEHPLSSGHWVNPSEAKSSIQSDLRNDSSTIRNSRTLEPNISNYQCQAATGNTIHNHRKVQQSTVRRTLCKVKSDMNTPPVLLMLNKDFIVTSPLKENLLLTLALMAKRSSTDTSENVHSSEGEAKRQILVGQFKAFSSFLNFMLGQDAMRVRTESNAGGTSTISESLSVEYFVRRFQATDIVTEMEVEYRSFNWKKVDYICTLYGQRVGVSVTRAMSFPDPKDFSAQMAYRLLNKKLFGLVVARHGVSKRHSFSQCILHVWCETQETAGIMQREYDGVSQELDIADDMVMVLTVADGWHARPIFYESILRSPPD